MIHVSSILIRVSSCRHGILELCSDVSVILCPQMVVLMDPLEDRDDVLRVNRSREKQFVFDLTVDGTASQVGCKDEQIMQQCSLYAECSLLFLFTSSDCLNRFFYMFSVTVIYVCLTILFHVMLKYVYSGTSVCGHLTSTVTSLVRSPP